MPTLFVYLPCYNEAGNLRRLTEEWLDMSGQVLILGAELSASLIHRKKHAAPSSGGEEEA